MDLGDNEMLGFYAQVDEDESSSPINVFLAGFVSQASQKQ